MRIIIFFFVFLYLSFCSSLFAEEQIPTFTETKKLHTILELDSWPRTQMNKIKRNNLFISATKNSTILRRIWNLRPTFDATLRYTPYLQKYPLSCEIAALSMILWSMGSPTSEDIIIAQLPKYSQVYTWGIWWDPDKEFVWYITWSQRRSTWYGIYAQPLADIVKSDFHTEIFSLTKDENNASRKAKEKMSEYLFEIESWGHVLLWGDWCTMKEHEDGILLGGKSQIIKMFPIAGKNECQRNQEQRIMEWVTPEGVRVLWVSWEHAFLLLGYVGKIENPSHIIVWDTDTWRHIYPTSEWMRKWALLDYRALFIRNFE
jgi:hypothetical protein